MGLFKPDSKGKYIRWKLNNTLYVGCKIAAKHVQANVDALPFGVSATGSRVWYVLDSDLFDSTGAERSKAPKPFTLYFEDDNGTLREVSLKEEERIVTGWVKTFRTAATVTLFEFNMRIGNLYGRFDNDPNSPTHYHYVFDKDEARRAASFLKDLSREVLNPCKVESTEPDKKAFVKVSLNSKFETYIVKSELKSERIDITEIDKKLIGKVHEDTFGGKTFAGNKRPQYNTITYEQVRIWSSLSRESKQSDVMNKISARDLANLLKLPTEVQYKNVKRPLDYEWLHLIAFSMGPSRFNVTPQNTENLVLGTKAANTLMLAHEQLIKLSIPKGGKATVSVKATSCETDSKKYTQWLASNLVYRYTVFDNTDNAIFSETVNINPFKLVTPTFSEAKLMENLYMPAQAIDDDSD